MMKILDTSRLNRTSRAFAALVSVLVCAGPALPLPAVAQAGAAPRVQLADAIVAVVNEEVITRNELDERLRRAERTLRAQGINLPPQAEFEHQVLESMIIDLAQLQRAREIGIRIDDATVDRALAGIAQNNGLALPEFRARLESEGLSFVSFRQDVRDQLTMQRLREREVDSKVQVAESEIDNYLAADAKAAASAQEYSLAHILVRIPENASAEEIAHSRQRAEEVLTKLQQGADFATLAATYSDASDALTGGDLGWRTRARLPQLFIDALPQLEQNQVSPLLRSANGFHILKLNGKRSAQASDSLANAAVEQTHVRHILIKVNKVVSASEARRRLVELKQRLDNGAATFEELARTFSNDLSASRGGDLGWVYPGDTVPQFERAMNQLKPGEISDPVETPFGYHLIQVVERKQDDVSDERKRYAARQAIHARKAEEATQDWLRQLRDSTYVEYRLEESRY